MEMDQFLQLPDLQRATVLAGEKGRRRIIGNVKMMDAPDILHYLTKDDLLITTAYHYVDKPETLLALVKAMNEMGCAGLGIKQERFFRQDTGASPSVCRSASLSDYSSARASWFK